jgi:hypothetical protein
LGDDPNTFSELFFIATKTINPGDWMTWYYGHFHGIFKRNSDDSSSDEQSQIDANDSEDDAAQTAIKMSAKLTADHKLALDLSNSLREGVDDRQKEVQAPVVISSSDSETEGTDHITNRVPCKRKLATVDNLPSGIPSEQSLCIHDKCCIASTAPDGSVRFQTCFVKAKSTNALTGFITHYDVAYGTSSNPTRCVIDAVQAHEDLAEHSRAKQKRKQGNWILREEEQEAIRKESAKRFHKGELVFVPGLSPGHSPLRSGTEFGNEAALESDANAKLMDCNSMYDLDEGDFNGTYHEDLELEEGISDEDNQNLNESAIDALEMSKSALTIELSTSSAEEIWALFTNKALRGGSMARTLFIAGKALESRICEPWPGDKKLGTKKADIADQRKSFLMWASTQRVLNWIRLELYKIVLSKPQTYKNFNVTHANGPKSFVSADGKDKLEASQASNHTMARIAHLACSSDSRVVLNMIFGPKALECMDAPDLTPTALWQDLATVYVNNPHWDICQIDVLQLQQVKNVNGSNVTSSLIDVSQVPVIGVTAECVRLVFNDIKKMWQDLANAVFSKTGCNSVGEELYGKVWTNYIHGKMLFFARPEVAMYVFKLWRECDSLPKYCKKELRPEAQVRMGVKDELATENSKFTLPSTPRGSSGSQGFTSPTTPSTSSGDAMQAVASYLQMKVREMQHDDERIATAKASSVAPKFPQVKFGLN